tara:strand:+ start:1252 stop:2025 length:774 start_codon:yes stop_codon:yes gene_type:complete
MLNDDDLIRFSRQIIIPGFEEEGQEILMSKSIIIVGAGGLGCPTAMYCAAAGFGNIEIWDHDIVELSNLNRQIGHTVNDIGTKKSVSLSETCKKINPNINIHSKNKTFEVDNDLKKHDIIFDCSDNFKSRYIINEIAHKHRKTLISGSATQFEGQVSVFKSGLYNDFPCYECVFPKTTETFMNFNCREAGILGSVTNLIASLQVTEGIRESLIKNKHKNNNFFLNKSNAGYLILYDAALQEMTKIKINKNLKCKICN